MNRITELFNKKQKNVLSIFYTAGFPGIDSTMPTAEALQNAGVDMLEIGFPYSDPLADGPVIQNSSKIALEQGMTLKLLFEQIKDLRKTVKIPVLLMGYFNPMLQYGVENFCESCAECGIDGVIVPDLPMQEFEEEYKAIFEKHKLSNIFLVTPQSSIDRIKKLDSLSQGFIYALSSSSTTGSNKTIDDNTTDRYLQKLADLKLQNPIMVGFGIRDKATFEAACTHTSGAIIGSAFVSWLADGKKTEDFVAGIKN